MKGRAFRVHGMCCQEELLALRKQLEGLVGGEDQLQFDLLNSKMVVNADASKCSDAAIITAVSEIGLSAEPWDDSTKADTPAIRHNRWESLSVALSAVSLAGGLALQTWWVADSTPHPSIFLYLGCVMLGFWRVIPKAMMALRNLRPDMNLLMLTAVSGAFLIGEPFEGAMVSFLFALSLLLETWSMTRARRAVKNLLTSTPLRVVALDNDGNTHPSSPSDLEVGTLFLVKPGEVIPLDGKIVEGRSEVSQAPITGESVPVAKVEESEVFAGTINGDGTLIVESTKLAEDTTLSRISRLVNEAQLKRSPAEKFVERFARSYTPIVMILAMAVAVIPPLLFSYPADEWIYRALVLLVVACPCALVISTPVSVVSGLTSAARQGVLIKGGEFLEASAHLNAIAFDKTGTLTKGVPQVVQLEPLNGHTEGELLERAASLEMSSQHPIAQAIVSAAQERGITPPRCKDFQNFPGKGSSGLVRNKRFWIGSHRFMEENGQNTREIHKLVRGLSKQGNSIVAIGNETHVCGLIAVTDMPRDNAAEVIHSLQEDQVEVVMLTGDNTSTAESIAQKLGVQRVYAELLPEDKITVVQELLKSHTSVAMVGDGINDAPALAQATIGFAMGTAGSDLAIETADVALMSDDLSKIPWLIKHARKTLGIIKQNITFSLFSKAVVLALSIAGYASLWLAIAADTGTSLLVIANGLRALTVTKPSSLQGKL